MCMAAAPTVFRRFFHKLVLLPAVVLGLGSQYSTMILGPVPGYEGRHNDVLYVPPKQQVTSKDVVVFFPGDIQNYESEMRKEESSGGLLDRSLERVAMDLSGKLPDRHIMVVKPSRTTRGVYNFYDNFVTLNKFGCPDYDKTGHALLHLCHLVNNALSRTASDLCHNEDNNFRLLQTQTGKASKDCHKRDNILEAHDNHQEEHTATREDSSRSPVISSSTKCHKTEESKQGRLSKVEAETAESLSTSASEVVSISTALLENPSGSRHHLEASKSECDAGFDTVALVGFSKGCVVLNQLLMEINHMSDLEEQQRIQCNNFLQKVREMAWLDGGHQGREGTWVTNPNIIKKFVKSIPALHITVHVTPYQMSDASRKWIGNECRMFVQTCRDAGAALSYTLHAADVAPPYTLQTHFLALDAYTGAIVCGCYTERQGVGIDDVTRRHSALVPVPITAAPVSGQNLEVNS